MRHSRLSREEIRSDMAESLQDLQTEYVDIFWLHRDDENHPVGEIMEKLRILRGETGLSVGALALAYLNHQPFPTFALIGASRIEHVLALQEAGDVMISPQQRDGLRSFESD